jgi:hypothetical protein
MKMMLGLGFSSMASSGLSKEKMNGMILKESIRRNG